MRKAIIAAAVLGITGAASADTVVEQIILSAVTPVLLGSQSVTYSVDVAGNNNDVLGFGFRGTVTGISGNATWASDMRLDMAAPSGNSFAVGGFSNPAPVSWAFDGSSSTNDGFYEDSFTAFAGEPKGGLWTISLRNDFNSSTANMVWDFEIYLIKKIPAPAGLALLGLAGLAGRRRRA